MHENHTEEARHLTTLPAEILHHIFSWIEPGDLVRVARVCRLFYDCIKGNQALCRAIYLLRLVSPEHCNDHHHQPVFPKEAIEC